MKELRDKLLKALTELNQDWLNAIKEGETSGGIDLGAMNSNFVEKFNNVDAALNEFAQNYEMRLKKVRRGIFGRG
jgi:hypothetical protein